MPKDRLFQEKVIIIFITILEISEMKFTSLTESEKKYNFSL